MRLQDGAGGRFSGGIRGKEGLKVFDAAFKCPKVFGKKISDEMIEEDFFRETDTKPIFDAEEHGKVSLFVYELNRSFGTIVGRGSVLQTVNDEVLETIRDEINRGETVVAVKVPVCVQQLVPEGKSLCRNRAGGAAHAGSTAQGLEAMYRTFIDTLGGTRNTTTNATKLIVLSINMFFGRVGQTPPTRQGGKRSTRGKRTLREF